ncbi:lysine transporter LysE [Ktedonosporobacter rubrisoli]|uniref:Lysine transporter LysE n=1 Tax=Ktedonosporobacter rubrisoli TaxID=2509675 RepID=A0A4V0YYF5_KTERU|nr:LysE family transporter [Ktedonosporobacter rubrisoli]QBD76041.1 lysine transporter LysE [Ktedonosporobacter rubrisoli]
MSYLPILLTLAGVTLIASISPGPDFATIVLYSTRSRRQGTFVGLGICSALVIWTIGSIAGLEVLLAQVSWLVDLLRTLGALYLAYLGIRTILHAHRPAPESSTQTTPASGFAAWRVGFISNIGNPKVLAFFSSIFIVLFPANPPLWVEFASVALVLGINILWYTVVVSVFSLKPVTRFYRRAKRWIDYVTGTILVGLGVRLALER